jgi:hypothetical protein
VERVVYEGNEKETLARCGKGKEEKKKRENGSAEE